MSEMVERVARAIDNAIAKWQPGSDQRIKEMAARAAIDAMRVPTDGMIEQMQVEVNLSQEQGHFELLSREEIVGIWERGLLEALK